MTQRKISAVFWGSILVVFGLLSNTQSLGQECVVDGLCSCGAPPGFVHCYNKNFTTVPKFIPTAAVHTVDLNNNNIHRLPAFAFANLTFSKSGTIYLHQNPLEFVDDLAFDGLQNVSMHLDLSHTRLARLPAALKALSNLRSLKVDGSCVLDAEVMQTIGQSLEAIYMVGVSVWPSALRYAPRLTFLYAHMRDNGVQLPLNAFEGLEDSLTKLDIENSLTIPKAIRRLDKIQLNLIISSVRCECDLTWLLHWDAMKEGRIDITGTCSNTMETIPNFLAHGLRLCDEIPIG